MNFFVRLPVQKLKTKEHLVLRTLVWDRAQKVINKSMLCVCTFVFIIMFSRLPHYNTNWSNSCSIQYEESLNDSMIMAHHRV